MTYCTIDDVLSLLPTIGTLRDAVAGSAGPPVVAAVTATVPSATQGAALLSATGAEIDMHLRAKGYALQVADAEALAYLKTVCMNGTAARIAKAKWPADAGAGGDAGAASTLREDYAAMLAFIDGGGLAGDTSQESEASVSHGFKDSTGDPLCAFITRETEF